MSFPDEIEVEVFRAGNYGDKGVYTDEDLMQIAKDYNPGQHEAPVTFDHEQKGPAHGWVKGIRAVGDRLLATISKASDELGIALRNGTYRKRSIELYRQYRETGRPYLKAISFLGAAAPEVKGLADPVFTEEVPAKTDAVDQLKRSGQWRPSWENHGLLNVFNALSDTPEHDKLVLFLKDHFPKVKEEGAVTTDKSQHLVYTEDIAPNADPQSIVRHQQAVAMMTENAKLTYREALLRLR